MCHLCEIPPLSHMDIIPQANEEMPDRGQIKEIVEDKTQLFLVCVGAYIDLHECSWPVIVNVFTCWLLAEAQGAVVIGL